MLGRESGEVLVMPVDEKGAADEFKEGFEAFEAERVDLVEDAQPE